MRIFDRIQINFRKSLSSEVHAIASEVFVITALINMGEFAPPLIDLICYILNNISFAFLIFWNIFLIQYFPNTPMISERTFIILYIVLLSEVTIFIIRFLVPSIFPEWSYIAILAYGAITITYILLAKSSKKELERIRFRFFQIPDDKAKK